MSHWHTQHPARGILARLTAADIHIVAATPILGDRYFRWSAGEQQERLEAARRAVVEDGFGHTFLWACDNNQARDYLAFDAKVPSVEDVLAERFGDPGRFGRPTDRVIDCDRAAHANALWRAEIAAEQGGELAA